VVLVLVCHFGLDLGLKNLVLFTSLDFRGRGRERRGREGRRGKRWEKRKRGERGEEGGGTGPPPIKSCLQACSVHYDVVNMVTHCSKQWRK